MPLGKPGVRRGGNAPTPASADGRAPRRRRVWKWAAAAAAAATAILVALLWKPSEASGRNGRPTFLESVASSGLALSAVGLIVGDKATVTVEQDNLADMAASLLEAGDPSVPPALSRAVRGKVPSVVETVAGCRISRDNVTLCLRCRKVVSFYVTIGGRALGRADGGLVYRVSSMRVGLVPVPVWIVGSRLDTREVVVVDPETTGFLVKAVTTGERRLVLDLERCREGAR